MYDRHKMTVRNYKKKIYILNKKNNVDFVQKQNLPFYETSSIQSSNK